MYLYAIQYSNGTKIGITADLNSRLKSYQKPWMREILNISVFPCSYASEVETVLKELLDERIVYPNSTEFIQMDYNELLVLIKNTINSYTSPLPVIYPKSKGRPENLKNYKQPILTANNALIAIADTKAKGHSTVN